MQARRAITSGLRRSFDFQGRSTRAEYLPFLAFAILLEAAALAFGAWALPKVFAACALISLILLYIPVTSAGVRRLRDAGQPPTLMLNPLKPAAAALIMLGLLWLAVKTPTGFTLFYLSALIASPIYVALAVVTVIGVSITTALCLSDTASRLLLPSVEGPSSLSKVQQ